MKKLLILICFFTLGISFLNAAAFAQSLAVVDTNKIFEQSKHGQSINSYFEKLQSEGIKQLEQLEDKRKKADEKKKKKLIQNLESEIQATAYELQNKIQNQQTVLFTVISDKLMNVIDTYRKDNNIDVILHATETASYNPDIDVTEKIIQEFNKIEFDIQKELKQ